MLNITMAILSHSFVISPSNRLRTHTPAINHVRDYIGKNMNTTTRSIDREVHLFFNAAIILATTYFFFGYIYVHIESL